MGERCHSPVYRRITQAFIFVDEGFLFWQAFRATAKQMVNEIIHLCWFAGSDQAMSPQFQRFRSWR